MRSRTNLLVVGGLFMVLTAASLAPIRSNDYFWHLATGRWIWEHRALPLTDPFGIASTRAPWINCEWLFEVLVYPLFQLGGHAAVAWALAIATGALFAAFYARNAGDKFAGATLLVIVIAWYGAEAWLHERPSAVGAACLAMVILLATRSAVVPLFLTVVLWANVHPSAIIAPIVVAILARRVAPVIASAAALLVNPWFIQGVLNPFRLVGEVGHFHNEEWAPSTPGEFPLFYAVVVAVLLLFIARRRREDLPRFLVFVLLTALAVRFCRNQGLFFVALPLLVLPSLPPVSLRIDRILGVAAAAVLVAVLAGAWWQTGVDATRFPVDAVARLKATGLEGRIYNTFGMGGFLIWELYPARRVITDGRNELYVAYNAEHERALVDGDAWHRFIRKWDLRLAVYERSREVVLQNGQRMPAARLYFPPREWALIAIDRAAVVFARRDAYPPDFLARWEIRPRGGADGRPAPQPAAAAPQPRTSP